MNKHVNILILRPEIYRRALSLEACKWPVVKVNNTMYVNFTGIYYFYRQKANRYGRTESTF